MFETALAGLLAPVAILAAVIIKLGPANTVLIAIAIAIEANAITDGGDG